MKEYEFNEKKFVVGENAKENDNLIKKYKDINSKYYWCHLHESSSAHCIICSEDITKKDLQFAKNCIQKHNNNEKIIVCKLLGIRRTDTPGLVEIKKKEMIF